jgi:hypothetical protein
MTELFDKIKVAPIEKRARVNLVTEVERWSGGRQARHQLGRHHPRKRMIQ